LGYFVLDNATNNDTTLAELAKLWGFDYKEKRLRCMGHVINLIAEAYLFGQDESSWDDDYKVAGPADRRKLWRRRGEVGKLHNLVAHVMASGKRTTLFLALQSQLNIGVAAGKEWKLVLDGGVRWNATYSMVRRGLELRQALTEYAVMLHVSTEPDDREIFDNDYLSSEEWETLEIIRDQLQPLFLLTKGLEGNAKMTEGALEPSHGALWESLIVLEHIMTHFETLETQSKQHQFNDHAGIQQSITLAWQACLKWYRKTDNSLAWQASMVLHPLYKWSFFEKNWKGNLAPFLVSAKSKFKKLWEDQYKGATVVSRATLSPEPVLAVPSVEKDYLKSILNAAAPIARPRNTVVSSRRDQYFHYLQEPPVEHMGVMEYWKLREAEWPQLAQMAFDFLAIPAMSSECERVFSSCSKQTTSESSNLSGETLWQQECLKNWQNRGAIEIAGAFKAILLDI
jgi:hypothetical protein